MVDTGMGLLVWAFAGIRLVGLNEPVGNEDILAGSHLVVPDVELAALFDDGGWGTVVFAATGILPVCIGRAGSIPRAIEFLVKLFFAMEVLGLSTRHNSGQHDEGREADSHRIILAHPLLTYWKVLRKWLSFWQALQGRE